MSRTLVLVKPDGVQRQLVGEVLGRFERKGLKIAALKLVALETAVVQEHYAHLNDKPFFGELVSFMT
ncbi:MAG: nucleoside-diphosphate kinase, partial [Solirubrobacteraceae bacterium]